MVRSGPTLALRYGGLLFSEALFEAIAVAIELQDVTVVGKTVQEGAGEAFVAEDLHPPCELQVSGNQQASLEVTVRADLEEEPGPICSKGDEAHLVQDEHYIIVIAHLAQAREKIRLGLNHPLYRLDNDRGEILAESADLMFHLLILWADQGIRPEEALDVLRARRGVSGLGEKKSRA